MSRNILILDRNPLNIKKFEYITLTLKPNDTVRQCLSHTQEADQKGFPPPLSINGRAGRQRPT